VTNTRPIIIAHRGASGYRPEHTIASYALAIETGADYVEPDLVMTKDGVLIARHEPLLAEVNAAGELIGHNTTTDVAKRKKFADRLTTRDLDGSPHTGWWASDFTLMEIKTLRAVQRLSFRGTTFDGQFEIPTFQEIIDLAKRSTSPRGEPIGVYPETKHPTFHESLGLPVHDAVVTILKANGLDRATSPVFVQSFEVGNLRRLREALDVRLVQLSDAEDREPFDVKGLTYGQMLSPAGLGDIARYANAIGPNKRSIVPVDKHGMTLPPTSLVADAHAAGLTVHPWTFRNESVFLAKDYGGDPRREYQQFFELGVDGLFSDFPDTALSARSNIG
jgi:glycerophosphoryl diester phosphodiesterase